MSRTYVMTVFILICACGQSESESAPQSQQSIVANGTRELSRSLMTAHATFDGKLITRLHQTVHCEAVITTLSGSIAVHWKDLGDLIERLNDGQRVFYVPFGGRPHVISVRNGEAADGIGAGLSLLDEECGRVKSAS